MSVEMLNIILYVSLGACACALVLSRRQLATLRKLADNLSRTQADLKRANDALGSTVSTLKSVINSRINTEKDLLELVKHLETRIEETRINKLFDSPK